jgi:hypothetical protein
MGGGIGKFFHKDPKAEAAKKTSTKIMQVLAKKKGEVDKNGQPMSFEKYQILSCLSF